MLIGTFSSNHGGYMALCVAQFLNFGVCRSRQMLRICRCGCFGKKVQNLDIYSSWGQNASQLGHPETFENALGLPWGLSGGPGLSFRDAVRSKELANAAGRKADK